MESLKYLSLQSEDQIEFVQFITHFSQGSFAVNWQDERGRTPLHSAVMKGDSTIVELLLSSNTDINILDKDSYSPLGLALRDEKTNITHTLLNQS